MDDYDYDQLSVDFKIDGVRMTAGTAPAALRPQLAAIEDDLRRKLAGLKDAKTGRPPKVQMEGKVEGTKVGSLNFAVVGSKEVIEEAQKRMGG
ncbi:hypothetical protein [Terricaulis silvestris]|uniref:Uncharacterized protein n=1 Tax=Terricaulis silvestris TaxID=2686094 RepID=A0A6I6MKA7_9CAUL|nr:hypothetical protein [Terricaulis silvestris]QGZ95670.1 hypothetical protein DSM104635_02520 [Terricaulis silvestris]